MPVRTRKQRRLMGAAYAAKKGAKPISKKVAKIAKSMTKQQLKDFASTKEKNLPLRIKKKRGKK